MEAVEKLYTGSQNVVLLFATLFQFYQLNFFLILFEFVDTK